MATFATGAFGRLVCQRDRLEVGVAREVARDPRMAALAGVAADELRRFLLASRGAGRKRRA